MVDSKIYQTNTKYHDCKFQKSEAYFKIIATACHHFSHSAYISASCFSDAGLPSGEVLTCLQQAKPEFGMTKKISQKICQKKSEKQYSLAPAQHELHTFSAACAAGISHAQQSASTSCYSRRQCPVKLCLPQAFFNY